MKKILTFALLVAIAAALSVPALGAINTTDVSITYRDIRMILNGKELSPTDENGESTEPFIMEDSTYLPVRTVAEALELEVTWDNDSSTVYLSSADDSDGGKQVVSMIPDTAIQGAPGYVIAAESCSIFPYAENAYFSGASLCLNHLLRVDRRFLVETADGESEYWLLVSAYDGGQISDRQFYPAMRMEQVWIRESNVIPYTEGSAQQLVYPVWATENISDMYGAEVDSNIVYSISDIGDGCVRISAPGGIEHWIEAEELIYPELAIYGHSYLN